MNTNPASYDIVVTRGATLQLQFQLQDDDGVAVAIPPEYLPRGQVRSEAGRTGTSTAATLLLDLAAKLEIVDFPNGIVQLDLTAADSITLNPANGRVQAFYEIELYDPTSSL